MVSSSGPYGVGGLGQHLAAVVAALRGAGRLHSYLTPEPATKDDRRTGVEITAPTLRSRLHTLPPVRFSPGLRVLLNNTVFDYTAASHLPRTADHLLVFNGCGLRQIRRARQHKYGSVGLVSATVHLGHLAKEYRKAWEQYPIEKPWADSNVKRNLSEYRDADYVHVSSEYAWNSFVGEGFPSERLKLFPLVPDRRFSQRKQAPTASTFNVIYIGSLSVAKGTPLLIEAIRGLPYDDLRLVLVGGWSTRGMRRYIQAACAMDRRLTISPGDPLPHLLQAGVAVHPSFGEGCSYAPGEALATGVPLIASDNTGLNASIAAPGQLHFVSTGDLPALRNAIDVAYHGNLA